MQVVWVGSKQLGAGFAKSKSGRTYVVAKYIPRGNMVGDFPANVKSSGSRVEVVPDINANNENDVKSSTSKKPKKIGRACLLL